MKRVIVSLLVVAGLVTSWGGVVMAQDELFGPVCDGVSGSTVCQEAGQAQTPTDNAIWGPNGVMTRAVGLISLIIGIAAVFVLVYAGFKYITAGGDANSVASAKHAAQYALIGVLVALFARGLIIFVFDRL
jgi:Type IV secretion system pilin